MGYCKACGAALDEQGICTNEKCKRRALQIAANEAKQAAETAKTQAEQERLSARSSAKIAFLGEDAAKKQAMNINKDWR